MDRRREQSQIPLSFNACGLWASWGQWLCCTSVMPLAGANLHPGDSKEPKKVLRIMVLSWLLLLLSSTIFASFFLPSYSVQFAKHPPGAPSFCRRWSAVPTLLSHPSSVPGLAGAPCPSDSLCSWLLLITLKEKVDQEAMLLEGVVATSQPALLSHPLPPDSPPAC